MPFISSKDFRLKFPSDLSHLAVGKISIGYHDMDGKLKSKICSQTEQIHTNFRVDNWICLR